MPLMLGVRLHRIEIRNTMKTGKKALIAALSVVVIIIGLRVCVSFTPVQVGTVGIFGGIFGVRA